MRGTLLVQARKRAKLVQQDVAEKVGISLRKVRDLETGGGTCTLTVAKSLAAELDVRLTELVADALPASTVEPATSPAAVRIKDIVAVLKEHLGVTRERLFRDGQGVLLTLRNGVEVVVWTGPNDPEALDASLAKEAVTPTLVVALRRFRAPSDRPARLRRRWVILADDLDAFVAWFPMLPGALSASLLERADDYPLHAFVDPLVRDVRTNGASDALPRIRRWLKDPTPLLLVLGDYGVGKTFLSRKVANELNAAGSLVLRVDLAQVPMGRDRAPPTLEHVVLAGLNQLHFSATTEVVAQVYGGVAAGAVVLVADAFDELAVRLDPADVRPAFAALQPGSEARILVTCRPHYFESSQHLTSEVEGTLPLLRGNLPNAYTQLVIEAYDDARVAKLIAALAPGTDPARVFALLSSVHDLRDLAKRPVLLRLILTEIDELEAMRGRGQVTTARLYEGLTMAWLERDRRKHQLPPETKLAFMEELAVALRSSGAYLLSVADLRKRLATHLGERVRHDDLRQFLADVRVASFLIRVDDQFRFAHQSFAEFFFARRVADHLVAGNVAPLAESTAISPVVAEFILECVEAGIGVTGDGQRSSPEDRRRRAGASIEAFLTSTKKRGKENVLELSLHWYRSGRPNAPRVSG